MPCRCCCKWIAATGGNQVHHRTPVGENLVEAAQGGVIGDCRESARAERLVTFGPCRDHASGAPQGPSDAETPAITRARLYLSFTPSRESSEEAVRHGIVALAKVPEFTRE